MFNNKTVSIYGKAKEAFYEKKSKNIIILCLTTKQQVFMGRQKRIFT